MIINEDFFDSQDITVKDYSPIEVEKNPADKNSYTHTVSVLLSFSNRIDSYRGMQNNKQWLYDRIVWIITMFERFIHRCMDSFDDDYLLEYTILFSGDDREGKKETANFFGRDMFVNEDGRRGKPNTLVAMIYFNPGTNHRNIMRWAKRMREITVFADKDKFSELGFSLSTWMNTITVFDGVIDYSGDSKTVFPKQSEPPSRFDAYIKHRYFVQTNNEHNINATYNLDQDISTLYSFLGPMFGITYDEIIRYFFGKECPAGNDFPRIKEAYRFMAQYTFIDIRHQSITNNLSDFFAEGVFETLFTFPEVDDQMVTKMLPYQITIDTKTGRFVEACEPDNDFLICVLLYKPCRHIILLAHKTGSVKSTDTREYNLTYLSKEQTYEKDTFGSVDSFREWVASDAVRQRIVNYIGTGNSSDDSGIENTYSILKKYIQ